MASKIWLDETASAFGRGFRIYESANFLLLTAEPERYAQNLLTFAERARKRILLDLVGVASDEGYGKHVIIMCESHKQYYAYIAHFYPAEGEFAFSSGIYVNRGYGHVVLPSAELALVEAVVAHEYTHAFLAHLAVPLWLNEGIAVTMEDAVTGASPLRIDAEAFARHRKFWGGDEVQEFWSGASFFRPDEGNELSYQLARLAVRALSPDYERFREFVLRAEYRDAGESAAQEVFGTSLGKLIEQFFGPGDWVPAPDRWRSVRADPRYSRRTQANKESICARG